MRVSVLVHSAGTVVVLCGGCTFNIWFSALRFGGTEYIVFTATLLVLVRAANVRSAVC